LSEVRVKFSTQDGLQLEGLLSEGKGGGRGWIILCHPHPLYGGDMDNNVVGALQSALAEKGLSTLRFNFRGVGGREGEYGEGAAEVEDVRGAVNFITTEQGGGERLCLLGYSFGAYVGVRGVAGDDRVKALVCISPPVAMYDFTSLREDERPKLIVAGGRDFICPLPPVEELFLSLPQPKVLQIVSGADHFWWGMEQRAADYVIDFLQGLWWG
jgi:alpha/beta superfamily hydrolase